MAFVLVLYFTQSTLFKILFHPVIYREIINEPSHVLLFRVADSGRVTCSARISGLLRPPYWTLQVSEVMGLGAELASGGVRGRQTPTKRGGPPPGLSRP